MPCLQKCFQAKINKKSNRGLATFDKINYFPISFIESLHLGSVAEKESKSEMKQSLSVLEKKVIKKLVRSVNIIQAIEEDGAQDQVD